MQYNSSIYSPDQDHVYYNINLVNNSNTSLQAQFFDQKTTPILMDPSKYNVAIARASVPSAAIQLFNFPLPTGGLIKIAINNPGTGYVIGDLLVVSQSGNVTGTVEVNGINSSGVITNLQVDLQGNGYTVANGVSCTGGSGTNATINILSVTTINLATAQTNQYWITLVDNASGNAYSQQLSFVNNSTFNDDRVYNTQGFVDSINNGFIEAVNALNTGEGSTVISQNPFLYYGSDGKFVLYIGNDAKTSVQIWWNAALYLKFGAFYVFWNGTYNAANHLDFRFHLDDYGYGINTVAITDNSAAMGAVTYWWTYSQSSSQSYSLIDLRALVFTSASLPVINESISQYTPNPTTTIANTTNSNSSLNIVGDLEPNIDTYQNLIQSEVIQYTPSLLRLEPMATNIPLKAVDMTVYWRSNIGQLNPLFIDPGQSMNIKLAFVKKGLAS